MPKAIMASIIFVALKNMIKFSSARKLYSISKEDFALFVVAFAATAALGVTWGIALSILCSLVFLIKLQARPATRTLAVLPGTNLCVDFKRFPEAREIRGVKIFSFGAALHFANKDHFEKKLKKMESRCQWNKMHIVIINCSCITSIDTTCVSMLKRLQARYDAGGVKLVFANLQSWEMRTFLRKSGLYDTIDTGRFFLTMDAALAYAKDYVAEIAAHPMQEKKLLPIGDNGNCKNNEDGSSLQIAVQHKETEESKI